LLSDEGSLFAASVQVHPARLDPEDAKKLTIPHFCLATGGEDAEVVQKFKEAVEANEAIKDKSLVIRWEGTFHGFMAARANLQDKENLEYYEKG
jgi:dienelactone hydrolase